MQFKFFIGTKAFFGKDCVRKNCEIFSRYGKRALLVTGKNSAKSSGALIDVTEVLHGQGIEFKVFDAVENNPSLENVKIGGEAAASFNADFIVGIGGGSPLDAAKAIAVLAVNRMEPVELYKNTFERTPLPILAIPTTAGTGSEVTPYSILTRRDLQTKMSFGNEDTFPKVAFLDAGYTESLPWEVTVNTAIDAFSHAVEGYLNKRSTAVSDVMAMEAIRLFGESLEGLCNHRIHFELREKLLYMSMLGGMVISHTGTTIMHGMGYSLTYFKGTPHGKANGLLMTEYLKYNREYSDGKVDTILKALRRSSLEEFGQIMQQLLPDPMKLTLEEVKEYASLTMKQRSTSNNLRNVEEKEIQELLLKIGR